MGFVFTLTPWLKHNIHHSGFLIVQHILNIIPLTLPKDFCHWCSLELLQWGNSNEHQWHTCTWREKTNFTIFGLIFFSYLLLWQCWPLKDDNISHPVILNFTTDYNNSFGALVDNHTETFCAMKYLFGNYFHCVLEIIGQTKVHK